MDPKELFKGRNDFGGVGSSSDRDYKLALFRKCCKKVETDLLSTRNYFDYIVYQIEEVNERIFNDLILNQKCLKLLQEIMNKNQLCIDKLQMYFKEMYDILENKKTCD